MVFLMILILRFIMYQLNQFNKLFKKTIASKKRLILLLIILVALIIRFYFFTGLINTLPQDDGIYHNLAYKASKGDFLLTRYVNISADYKIGPHDSFVFRTFSYMPTAFFYYLFGVSEFTTALFSLICSIGSIILIYFFGKEFFNENTGLISAFLFSIFPLDIISSTRLTADIPLMLFMALSVFLFLKGIKYDDKRQILLSGIFIGIGYLVKVTSILLIGVFIIFIIYLVYKKRFKFFYLLFILGFLIVFSFEGLVLFIIDGDFFIRSHILNNAWIVKYYIQWEGVIDKGNGLVEFGALNIIYDPKTEFQHILTLFGLWKPSPKREMIEFFGYFYYFVFPAIALFFYRKLREKNTRKYFQYFLLLWIFILLIYLDFGFLKIEFVEDIIRYFMLFKAPRFLTIIIIPSLLILAWAINPTNLSLYFRKTYSYISNIFPKLKKYSNKKTKILEKRVAFSTLILILLFLSFNSLIVTNQTHNYLMQSVTDIKIANEVIQEYPDVRVYSDDDVIDMISYYNSYNREELYNINQDKDYAIQKGSIIILGGMRSIDLDYEAIVRNVPETFKEIIINETYPDNWILIKKITDDPFNIRMYNMTIYYLLGEYKVEI